MQGKNNEHRYDDIINLQHHVSTKHPQMSMIDRAAQFSPFAALTGYEDEVKETARLTSNKIDLDEESKAEINTKLNEVKENLNNNPTVEITYFVADEKKSGGKYVTCIGTVKKLDEYRSILIMNDNTKISFDDILSIVE